MEKILRQNVYCLKDKKETLTTLKEDTNLYHINLCCENKTQGSNNPIITIPFQNGPIKENGVNGCQNEDLISIVIDRLNDLQKKFSCRENAIAITKLEEALMWLDKRTADRIARGVEGLNLK